ncbi:MAG: hypothetical protein Q7U57_18325 [Methylovulum sp.]|nr:hypothetical protein [Methylovulum sp.]
MNTNKRKSLLFIALSLFCTVSFALELPKLELPKIKIDIKIPDLKASVKFRNETDTPIKVVMDSYREVHGIVPHGEAVFSPGIGDAPTFHVLNIDNDQEMGGCKSGPFGPGDHSLGWNGKSC